MVWNVVRLHHTIQVKIVRACNTRVPKALSNRTHQCPHCGIKLHRDHNAAIKILSKALGLRATNLRRDILAGKRC